MEDVQVDESELARAKRSVELWDQLPFSLAGQPRSYVLMQTVLQAGFRTGEAKIAMDDGRIRRAHGIEVPDAALAALSPNYRSADDPLTAMAAELGLCEGRVIEVTGARRGSAAFLTDRGPRTFPAWFLEIEDALGPAVVLDPDLERHAVAGLDGVFVARGTGVSGGSEVAIGHAEPTDMRLNAGPAAADGRTLTIRFVGSPEVYSDYPSADVVEGRNAVAIVPIAVDRPLPKPRRPRSIRLRHLPWHQRPGRAIRWFFKYWVLLRRPIAARLAYGQTREVTARLAEPLGDRVIVDWRTGRPLSM